jgi:hypothetical protein
MSVSCRIVTSCYLAEIMMASSMPLVSCADYARPFPDSTAHLQGFPRHEGASAHTSTRYLWPVGQLLPPEELRKIVLRCRHGPSPGWFICQSQNMIFMWKIKDVNIMNLSGTGNCHRAGQRGSRGRQGVIDL